MKDDIIKIKTISYFYPTSNNAKKYSKPNGGYLVEEWLDEKVLLGPFDTIDEAEKEAETINMPWSETYKKFCYIGSKFYKK